MFTEESAAHNHVRESQPSCQVLPGQSFSRSQPSCRVFLEPKCVESVREDYCSSAAWPHRFVHLPIFPVFFPSEVCVRVCVGSHETPNSRKL